MTRVGLHDTFEIFGAAVGALAVVVAFEAWRTRPVAGRALGVSEAAAGC